MTDRLRPRLQPSSAARLAPANVQAEKSKYSSNSSTGGTALLRLTERHRRRGWSQLRTREAKLVRLRSRGTPVMYHRETLHAARRWVTSHPALCRHNH
jgi:hypothetical protein